MSSIRTSYLGSRKIEISIEKLLTHVVNNEKIKAAELIDLDPYLLFRKGRVVLPSFQFSPEITAFQAALIMLNPVMWKMILKKVATHEHSRRQLLAQFIELDNNPKPFGDFYNFDEIQALEEFRDFFNSGTPCRSEKELAQLWIGRVGGAQRKMAPHIVGLTYCQSDDDDKLYLIKCFIKTINWFPLISSRTDNQLSNSQLGVTYAIRRDAKSTIPAVACWMAHADNVEADLKILRKARDYVLNEYQLLKLSLSAELNIKVVSEKLTEEKAPAESKQVDPQNEYEKSPQSKTSSYFSTQLLTSTVSNFFNYFATPLKDPEEDQKSITNTPHQ